MNESTSNKSKIEFVARIVNPDGKVVEKTITSYSELPSLDDFDLETREGFLAVIAFLLVNNLIIEMIYHNHQENDWFYKHRIPMLIPTSVKCA